ncbi:hypothetical protein N665_0096s0010 [Sinapis alba]|nr:hypothetical protein N665_0096s0010 [Sinapis alba]
MSLVDYDDSSSDDDILPSAEHKEALPQPPQEKTSPPKSRRSLNEKEEREGLPQLLDALLLVELPTLTHVSGGGDLNGNSSSLPRLPKVPRGVFPHSKNIIGTLSNVLVPPQLKGRSNVATEDMSMLFVKKKWQESSKATPPNDYFRQI